jgi:flavin reductase (DIM6/NTAB) family NADH-FMN oxidoreductase RutF
VSDLRKAHRLLAPRIAYLIGTRAADGTRNLIPVSNVTSISTDPQQLAVAVYKQWETHRTLLAADGCIGQQESVLLSLPAKLLHVMDLVARQKPPQRVEQLHRYILVKQHAHRIKPGAWPGTRRCIGRG